MANQILTKPKIILELNPLA